MFVRQALKSALECRGELDTGGGRSFWECVKQRATPADRLPLCRGARVRTGQFTTERSVAAGQAVRFHHDPEMLFRLEPFKTGKCPDSRLLRALVTSGL